MLWTRFRIVSHEADAALPGALPTLPAAGQAHPGASGRASLVVGLGGSPHCPRTNASHREGGQAAEEPPVTGAGAEQ